MTDEPNIGPVTAEDRLALINDPALRAWYEQMMADLNADAEEYVKDVVATLQQHELGVIEDDTGLATEPVTRQGAPQRRTSRRRIRRSPR